MSTFFVYHTEAAAQHKQYIVDVNKTIFNVIANRRTLLLLYTGEIIMCAEVLFSLNTTKYLDLYLC